MLGFILTQYALYGSLNVCIFNVAGPEGTWSPNRESGSAMFGLLKHTELRLFGYYNCNNYGSEWTNLLYFLLLFLSCPKLLAYYSESNWYQRSPHSVNTLPALPFCVVLCAAHRARS